MVIEIEIIFQYNFPRLYDEKGRVFMQNLRKYIFLFFFLLISFPQETWAQEGKRSLLPLTIRGKTIKVEVVRTEKEKERGLMFRERLGKDEGMLFVYEREEMLSFWMKNTPLPLSIAFIDKDGRIEDIQDMEPFSLEAHTSTGPARYALEMNRGWFAREGIRVGDVIKIPSSLRTNDAVKRRRGDAENTGRGDGGNEDRNNHRRVYHRVSVSAQRSLR